MRRALVLAGIALLLAGRACWAEGPSLVVRRTGKAPHIDGRLSEPEWGKAFTATGFVLLGTAAAPTQATIARALFDGERLYVAFECQEDQREAMVSLVEVGDGEVYTDDCVEFFVSAGPDPSAYRHFVVNARGVLRDERGRDETWDSGAVAAAVLTPDGWTAELSVPLADLGLTAMTGTDWWASFCREERPRGELSSWSPCQEGFHEPGRFGRLTGLDVDVARYARAGLQARLGQARAELRPALATVARARPLRAAGRAVRLVEAAETELARAEGVAAQRSAALPQLREAEASLGKALSTLTELRLELPRLAMSLALREAGKPATYAVCQASAMARVRPTEPFEGRPSERVTVSLAAGEYEAAQIVVVPVEEALAGVRLSVSPLRDGSRASLPESEVTVNAVGCVNITTPSGRSGAAPGLYPDPLLPNTPRDIEEKTVASWLVTVHAPPGQPAGTYVGRLTVEADNAPRQSLPFRVTVWGFELPRTSRLRTCFQLLPAYLWRYYQVPPVEGVPVGWEWGVWTGADVTGTPNYFGAGVFRSRFDTDSPHSGKRALRIDCESATPGAVETPRACYHRLLPVGPQTEYEVTVWYRTQGLADGQAQVNVHTHNAHLGLTASEAWRQARLRFNSGEAQEARVYLGLHAPGSVWFDDVSLAPVGEPAANAAPDPSFEEGGSFEDRDRLLRAYRLNALQHRCSDMNIAAPRVEVSGTGEVTIDWSAFDREIEFYREHGLNAFNVGWARVPGGWGSVAEAPDEAALQVSAEILRQTEQHLTERGWLDLAYLYTIDEPGQDAFSAVKDVFDHVRRAAPGLKRLLTFGYGASRPLEPGRPLYRRLEGYVDIWVPHSDCFEPQYLETRRRAGDEIWEYVCISAQKPYANMWGIDYPGSDPRVVFWQCWAEEITGFLYWATNYWEKDPWQDPLTYPGGNSDGSLFYYGPDGPVNSLRWETIRDGIEDYDYLALLDGLVRQAEAEGRDASLCGEARKLLDVSEVTRSFTDYTTSPEPIERHRAAVARAIERLQSGGRATVHP